jgi:hypothetical protein
MASDNQIDDETSPPELRAEVRPLPPRFRKSRVWIASVALAAFALFSWYAYQQATRTGEQTVAPLIAADEQPTRAKPEEPGGMEIPHQDKSVYERLGTEEPPPKVETLLPPPETPMEKPGAEQQTAAAPPPPPAPPTQAKAAAPVPPAASEAKASAPADEMAKVAPAAGPGGPAGAAKTPEAAAASAAPPTAIPTTTAMPTMTTAAATAPGAAAPQATEGGRYRIQISAVRSEQAAETEWKRVKATHGDLLGNLTPNIVRVDLGAKGTFYRVQAGALTEAAARDLCAELKKRKADCIVVKP